MCEEWGVCAPVWFFLCLFLCFTLRAADRVFTSAPASLPACFSLFLSSSRLCLSSVWNSFSFRRSTLRMFSSACLHLTPPHQTPPFSSACSACSTVCGGVPVCPGGVEPRCSERGRRRHGGCRATAKDPGRRIPPAKVRGPRGPRGRREVQVVTRYTHII